MIDYVKKIATKYRRHKYVLTEMHEGSKVYPTYICKNCLRLLNTETWEKGNLSRDIKYGCPGRGHNRVPLRTRISLKNRD